MIAATLQRRGALRRSGLAALVLAVPFVVWIAWVAWVGGFGYTAADGARAPAAAAAPAPGHAWRGVVHVHGDHSSDATGSVEEIAAAAGAAGLDFVVLTDHTRAAGTAGRARGGWYGDVLVVIGEEISTAGGHLVALGVPPHAFELGPTATQALRDVAGLGGGSVIAHPGGAESAWSGGFAAVDGMEVLSASEALGGASWAARLGALALYPINPRLAALRILAGEADSVARWDALTRSEGGGVPRRLAALGSVDAHGPVVGVGPLAAPSYRQAFDAVTMTVWLETAPGSTAVPDRRVSAELVAALLAGRSAIVVAALGQPGELRFTAHGDGEVLAPGQAAPWRGGEWQMRARFDAPAPHRIDLLRDGAAVASSDSAPLAATVDRPGTYRVRIVRTDAAASRHAGDLPWVLTNPVYLWPDPVLVASRRTLVPPLPPPTIALDLLPLPAWSAESDPTSMSAMAAGVDGTRWEVRLPPLEATTAYSGLIWRPVEPRGLREFGGLVVGLRSAREWRVSVRVWTHTEEGALRTWERVVPSGPDGPTTGISWRQFRPLEAERVAAGDEIEDHLERVDSIGLVITPLRMRPGTEAAFEVLAVGLYDDPGS